MSAVNNWLPRTDADSTFRVFSRKHFRLHSWVNQNNVSVEVGTVWNNLWAKLTRWEQIFCHKIILLLSNNIHWKIKLVSVYFTLFYNNTLCQIVWDNHKNQNLNTNLLLSAHSDCHLVQIIVGCSLNTTSLNYNQEK